MHVCDVSVPGDKKLSCSRLWLVWPLLVAGLLLCNAGTPEAHGQISIPGSGTIATVAGNGVYGHSGNNGQATRAELAQPVGVALDSAANLYIADCGYNVVRKVTAANGVITLVAGKGTAGYSGDGGLATSARLYCPQGLAVDGAGNLYISDTANNRIRKVAASTGDISTVAGNGDGGYSGDGSTATGAELNGPSAVALDSAGNLYIADTDNNVIRKFWAATGDITTIAGNGTAGYLGDSGAATSAELNLPGGVIVGANGDIFIADSGNNVIRKVSAATGNITTLAGNGTAGYSGDGGAGSSAELNSPQAVAIDAAGNLYVADSNNNAIRSVANSTGIITTIAGNGTAGYAGDGGAATSAELDAPPGIAVDANGNIYIADVGNLRIRAVGSIISEPTTSSPAVTWPTPAAIIYGTPLSAVQLNATSSISGTFTYNPAAGTVLTAGLQALSVTFTPNDPAQYSTTMATVPLTVMPATPTISWAAPAPILYGTALSAMQLDAAASVPGSFTYNPTAGTVPEPGSQTLSVTFTPTDTTDFNTATASVTLTVSIAPGSGFITTIAGTGLWGDTGDGSSATSANLADPSSVAVDASGNIYFADRYYGVVRKITASTGVITTIAGTGTSGYSGDGGAATSAKLNQPQGLFVDAAGNVFIADTLNFRIRKVAASTGIITTVAGNGNGGYTGDGGAATAATLCDPSAVVEDSAGNLYISDSNNNVIREVSAATGVITTIVGNNIAGYSGDGGPASAAQINFPVGLAIDAAGNLYFADSNNNVIRRISSATGTIATVAGNGTAGYTGNGAPATGAELNSPQLLAFDSLGNLYIADAGNNVVRELMASTGTITTVAGDGTAGYAGDGGEATAAELNGAPGIALDSGGNIYIADAGNLRVRLVGALTTSTPVVVGITPPSATLLAGRTQAFTATVANATNPAVTWTISPSGNGSINAAGVYTAPASVSNRQTVVVTATSQTYPGNSGSAVVTLESPVTISISPTDATLQAGQTQQLSASVMNAADSAVTWSITPSGAGSVSPGGLYTAPANVSAEQTVTVTATSEADSTKGASATIAVKPTCVSNGYGFERAIVIDHTKVPTSDQADFPFLFSVTDPTFATTVNGGHVTDPNAYDIIFSTDSGGQNKLSYELEEYDPSAGRVVAWVRIPVLSHTADTVLYMFYGNPNVTTSQQSPTAVWDSSFSAVYHINDAISGVSVVDSTSNGNDGVPGNNGIALPAATAGPFGADAAAFNGSQGIYLPSFSLNSFTISAWVYPTASDHTGAILGGPIRAMEARMRNDNALDLLQENIADIGASSIPLAINAWNYVAITYDGATARFYINGVPTGDSSGSYSFIPGNYTIGGADNGETFIGNLSELQLSNVVRSADWISAAYSDEGSPSVFYSLSTENAITISPGGISLYASQSQQFGAAPSNSCSATVVWSLSPAGLGTLSPTGIYTAPASITSHQTVTIIATNQEDSSQTGSALIQLLPPAAPGPTLSLVGASASPYETGSSQGFVATLKDQGGAPESGVTVTFTITGANGNTGSAVTDNNGIASYSYIGSNPGSDTVQASVSANGDSIQSNTLAVTWAGPATTSSEGSVNLVEGPNLGLTGLCGAFTDSNGTVIQPLDIGANPRILVVPAGATELQLGVDDDRFGDNTGSGFTVEVNGLQMTIPPTAMPWTWASGGQNFSYRYGIMDGTSPIVAATGLTAGSTVSIVYQSGTVSAGGFPYVNADGFQGEITGSINGSTGTHFPTIYMLSQSYPIGQPLELTATVKNGAGSPMQNVPATLSITGANPHQIQATTDSTGTTTFTYTGTAAGTDVLQVQAHPSGETSLLSNQASVLWSGFASLPPQGTLTLTPSTVQPLGEYGQLPFTVYAVDATGAPVPNVNVELVVSGVDNLDLNATTDPTGHAVFTYDDVNPGTASVVAIATIDDMIIYSNAVSVPWTLPAGPTTTSNGSGNAISISVSAQNPITLPSTLQLNATVTDNSLPSGGSVDSTWTQISGPGTVTFTSLQQAVTTASFSAAGNYVLQLAATDSVNTGSVQVPVTVYPAPGVTQGWIGSPANGATVSGVVPINVASNVSLESGFLTYYPANNINNVIVLNSNTTGSGQIGTLDTTTLANGSYWIQLRATDTTGDSEYSLALITVSGSYKPGRVTATVTDLVVPSTGLSISIQRQYDSLNANTNGDFGYGWSLATNVNLTVDPKGDVTFTLGGQRRTFYFTPQSLGFLFGGLYVPAFTPEPGFHGILTDSGLGCPALDLLIPDGSLWYCDGGGQFNPPGYIYTDATGTSYTISANGNLQSIVDRSGNTLTVTASGITSSTGLSVPFVRDSSGRITQITDPQGNSYLYSYDGSGNLSTVTYPNSTQPTTYTYDTNHLYTGGTDFRGSSLPTTAYYGPSDTDENGLPLNGRIQSVTDALNETTSYAYDLATNSTTVTYPPDATGTQGKATMVYDNYGMLLNSTDPMGHTTTNSYDANHNLVSVTDPMGYVTSYTYDQNGNQTSVTYPQTGTSTNTTSMTQYNEFSEPVSTTDELGNTRTFTYDANYNPQVVTDSAGVLASFQFSTSGQMQAGAIGYDLSVAPGSASQFSYDANGNLASRTDALGRNTSYTYDSLGHKLTMTIPLPNSNTSSAAATTTYQHDALGNLTQTAAPLGRTTSSQYDANGNKVSDTDALSRITTYQYDALNRLTTTTYPAQPATTTTKSYDFRNNVIDAVDQAGRDTHYGYDLAGRLVSVTKAFGTSAASTTAYTYDADGHKIAETDPRGNTTSYSYDAAGNLIATAGPGGSFQYGYDNARNRISMTDGNGHATGYQYDARKRLIQTTNPDGTTVTNGYDGPGNLTSVTDQAGNTVQYTYDAANQLKTVIQVDSPNTPNNVNSYGYDKDGNLTSLADANGHTTQNAFDLLYELTSKTLPDGSLAETRQYDGAGNLTSLTHFSGAVTTYAYDALNRLLTKTPDPTLNEPTVSFTYTPTGKRATMTDASGTTTYTYDSLDRLTSKAAPEGTLNYTYDASGNVGSITSGDDTVSVSYTWDNLNRLSTVNDSRIGLGSSTTTYSYDAANNLVTATYPNGLQSTFQYDQLNRLTSMTASNAGYLYNLGATGNRTGATELNGRTVTWSFDGVYRLTGETVNGDPSKYNGTVTYGLDPVGNRNSASSSLHGVSSAGFSYNADDQILSESYDANGNITATGGKTFAYNSDNQLKSMNGAAVTLIYDGDGNRVAKTVNGITTRYLVDDLNPTGYPQVVEETINGAAQREYTYGLQRIDEDQIVNNAWTPSFYGYDGFGSVRQLTNSSGSVTDSYEYDAFGNEISHTGTTPNNYLYRDEQYDPDLDMYYLRARYYNPQTGRFLSKDPETGDFTDPKTLHKYLYAGGDPVDAKDPSGRDALVENGEIDFWEVTKSTAAVAATGAAAACELQVGASLLQGLTFDATLPIEHISLNFSTCSAKVARGNSNCSAQDVKTCHDLYPHCVGAKCGGCLSYCLTQCEWPFHKPECNKWDFPKDWKDYPPSRWVH